MEPVTVAVVGAGYWGPNLIRNFQGSDLTTVRWVCDSDAEKGRRVATQWGVPHFSSDLHAVLEDPEVDAIAVATPAHTHAEIGMAALDAGKHVLIEKPLASTVEDAVRMVERADQRELILMCDHTYCYTPAVMKIRELVTSGVIGEIQYFDSVRINLGLIQSDIDVFWDLAPHDLSILDFVLDQGPRPTAVSAHAADPVGVGQACVGYLTLPLENGAIAHIHVNWLSPTKIRKTVIAGSNRMMVWDDLNPAQRLTVYDTGVETTREAIRDDRRSEILVSYRTGDIVAPALPEREALRAVVEEFATCIRTGATPLTDGRSGLRVVQILQAVRDSLRDGGPAIELR